MPPQAGPAAGADWAAVRARLAAAHAALERAWAPDRETEERILRSRARALARPAAAPEGDAIDALHFRLAGEPYAIELRHVREVLPLETLVPVPGVPEAVRGIAIIRGEVLSVMDLRALLGLTTRGLREVDYAVVLQSPSMSFAVLADGIEGLRRLPRAEIQAPAPIPGGGGAGYLLGVTVGRTAVLDGERLLADAVRLAEAGASGRNAVSGTPRPEDPPGHGANKEIER
ncbi:MAG: chemotaxis protein CheW [Burkholderiales bacterium]